MGMHRTYLTSAPSMILAVQRENAVCRLLQLLGPADPQVARQRGQHYWRALFGSDAIVNGLHGMNAYPFIEVINMASISTRIDF